MSFTPSSPIGGVAQVHCTLAPNQVNGVRISGAQERVVNGNYVVLNQWAVRNRRSIYCKIDPCFDEPRELLVTDQDGQWMVVGASEQRLIYSTGLAWGMYPTLATGWRQSKRSKKRCRSSTQPRPDLDARVDTKTDAKTKYNASVHKVITIPIGSIDIDSSSTQQELPVRQALEVSAITDARCAELLGQQRLLAVHSCRFASHALLRLMAACEAHGGLTASLARCELAMQTILGFMAPDWLRFVPDSCWQVSAERVLAQPVEGRRRGWIFCGPWMDVRDTAAVTVICRSECY